jgi:predicted site-specific integrase-resolvase
MDMSNQPDSPTPSVCTLEVYEPNPNVLYSLEATAHLARVPRRSVLIYCRAGLLRPVFQPPHGMMGFTEEAIYTIRRIEDVRAVHCMDVSCIKTMFDLLDEVERLRAEVRFFRSN